jgi:hypothetical protein
VESVVVQHYRVHLQRQIAILLRDAANYLNKYGWGRGTAWNPNRRTLDVRGAVAVAAGARKEQFLNANDAFECIPSGRLPLAQMAWECLDGYLGIDPVFWNDNTVESCVQITITLKNLADLLDAGASFSRG